MSYTELKHVKHMCSSSGLKAAFLLDDGSYCYELVIAICIVKDPDDDDWHATRTLILISEDGTLDIAEDTSNYAGICPIDVSFEEFTK